MKTKNLLLSMALMSSTVLADGAPPVTQAYVGPATSTLFTLIADAAGQNGSLEYFGWEEKLEQCQGKIISGKQLISNLAELADNLDLAATHKNAVQEGVKEMTARFGGKNLYHSRTIHCENRSCTETDTYCDGGHSLILVVGSED